MAKKKTCRSCIHCALELKLRQTNEDKEVIKELKCSYFNTTLKNPNICEKFEDHGTEHIVFE
jgi:hypothetical protein|tara:strand:- start:190 stop:375 length:186 start_codon:yes stop_codon:yes gene_type:complete